MKAATEKRRRERLSIYLVKPRLDDIDRVLKLGNAEDPIPLDLGAGRATLYVKKEVYRDPPPWTRLFSVLPEVPPDTFGRPNSLGAVLLYQMERTFLLSFGHGFHLIQGEAVERDFGLRVTLNSVQPGRLRSLDKASYDHNPLNHRTQSSRELDIFDLAMDSETEMLYAVTGASQEPLFGEQVTGRDALTLMVPVNAHGLALILRKALEKYEAPLSPQFDWVDNIARVRDPVELEILDLLLQDALDLQSHTNIWLGEPEIVDWETQTGYSFDQRPNKALHPTLDLDQLRKYLIEKGHGMTVDVLKSQDVYINDAEYRASKSWSAYRCLYAELRSGDVEYVLRNAVWYRVSEAFVSRVDRVLATLPASAIAFLPYNHDREEDFNAEVAAADPTFHLMDKKFLRIGGPYDKIEFCDLIKDGSALIHVKYYRSSATLSHLFAQGQVATETFVRDEDFRARLNPKLPAGARLRDPTKRPDPGRYTVVYAIATTKNLPADLPFFSKVTLKNAVGTLRALNFDVQLARIDVNPDLLKTTSFKPK